MLSAFAAHIVLIMGGWFFITRVWPKIETSGLNVFMYAVFISFQFTVGFIVETYHPRGRIKYAKKKRK